MARILSRLISVLVLDITFIQLVSIDFNIAQSLNIQRNQRVELIGCGAMFTSIISSENSLKRLKLRG